MLGRIPRAGYRNGSSDSNRAEPQSFAAVRTNREPRRTTFRDSASKASRSFAKPATLAGLPVVTEVMCEDDIAVICDHADMLQVGARNMQNFALLKKLANCGKPVLLKRGASATVKEWLAAAEYLLHGGNDNVILCERGIKTFDSSLRNTLDLAAVALVREMTHLPVIVDPSHATGKRSLIASTAKAAVAVGADGVIVEVHPDPDNAWSDGAQSLTFGLFDEMMAEIARPARSVYRPENVAAYC